MAGTGGAQGAQGAQGTAATGAVAALDREAVQAFAAGLRGGCLSPGDAGYDAARRVWNGMIDRRPGLIARCAGAADVIDAVRFARAHDLLLAVRGGGHNVAGTAVCDGGLMLDLSPMRGVRVDPDGRRAWVQGGATWGDVDRETQAFGLAAPGGVVSTTGVAGLTLSGGLGRLHRKYGLSCDNLVAADVVTADGRFLRASADAHPDLFWGLRGGGGNFGVVTAFEFQLHPVGPEVMVCTAMYPEERAGEVIRACREHQAAAPDELGVDLLFWAVPPAPQIPATLHGRRVLIVSGMYAGPADEGERLVRPLRALGEPVVDLSGRAPFAALQRRYDAFFPAGALHYYWKSRYLRGLDDAVIDAVVGHAAARPSSKTLVKLYHLGGAMSRVPADATAFGRRDAPVLLSIDTTWADPRDSELNIGWARAFWRDTAAFSPGGVYLSFPGLGEERGELVRAAYGANYDRLAALKRRYDPTNLFRLNQNIPPR
jgi:FAD/FMN-containing dehydrogenase